MKIKEIVSMEKKHLKTRILFKGYIYLLLYMIVIIMLAISISFIVKINNEKIRNIFFILFLIVLYAMLSKKYDYITKFADFIRKKVQKYTIKPNTIENFIVYFAYDNGNKKNKKEILNELNELNDLNRKKQNIFDFMYEFIFLSISTYVSIIISITLIQHKIDINEFLKVIYDKNTYIFLTIIVIYSFIKTSYEFYKNTFKKMIFEIFDVLCFHNKTINYYKTYLSSDLNKNVFISNCQDKQLMGDSHTY